MFILGAAIGSFLCCAVRRIHLRDEGTKLGSRSVCLHCRRRLRWYENIPILSWLFLRGRCKTCHRPIGTFEIFGEITTAVAFLIISTTIDLSTAIAFDWFIFIALFVLTSTLMFLALYDGMYGKLPTVALIVAAIAALLYAVFNVMEQHFVIGPTIASAATLGGLYLALYLISKGKWVGDGDWILAATIGLALGRPFLALIALFVSNFTASVIMWPSVHKTKNHKIYFGPFLVLAFLVTLLLSKYVIINV